MKKLIKYILIVFTILVVLLFLTSCTSPYDDSVMYQESKSGEYFIEINSWSDLTYKYSIRYAKDTKVMYLFIEKYYGVAVTPLYNEDGTLQKFELN